MPGRDFPEIRRAEKSARPESFAFSRGIKELGSNRHRHLIITIALTFLFSSLAISHLILELNESLFQRALSYNRSLFYISLTWNRRDTCEGGRSISLTTLYSSTCTYSWEGWKGLTCNLWCIRGEFRERCYENWSCSTGTTIYIWWLLYLICTTKWKHHTELHIVNVDISNVEKHRIITFFIIHVQ